ncbi:MAG: prolyl oligopeptidase family serine peptidase, partial [Myxococcota bacterium]
DGRYLLVGQQRGATANDVYFRDLHRPHLAAPPRAPTPSDHRSQVADQDDAPIGFTTLVAGRDALYQVEAWRDRFFVLTNEGAPMGRVFEVDPETPERASWREIIAEGDATLESLQVIGDHLVLRYLRKAHSELVIYELDGTRVRTVPLPGLGTVSGFVGTPERDQAYFTYESFVEPPQIYETSVTSGETSLWERIEVPADTSRFTVEQVWYPSRDGTKISMFIVRRKGHSPRGDSPTMLTGYGGFGISLTPRFSSRALMWLEHGGVYAVPNLRGGGEYGEDWHKDGMGARKQNVFDDFIAAAEFLIDKGYTRPGRLAIAGGSNGGLLVGATMVQRPDLMGAVICAVPLLDMIRYHLFGRGRLWVPEYGSADDSEQFATLRAYSPYHNAALDTPYPAFLMLSADTDDRVDPLHARKFIAVLQASRASTAPALLRIEKNAGHGGADSIRQGIERDADTYAFVMKHLGVQPATTPTASDHRSPAP